MTKYANYLCAVMYASLLERHKISTITARKWVRGQLNLLNCKQVHMAVRASPPQNYRPLYTCMCSVHHYMCADINSFARWHHRHLCAVCEGRGRGRKCTTIHTPHMHSNYILYYYIEKRMCFLVSMLYSCRVGGAHIYLNHKCK